MAAMIDIIFLLSIIINISIFFVKAYNVLSKNQLFDIRVNSLIWVLSVISWVFCFFVVLTTYDSIMYSVIFRFMSFVVLCTFLFYFIEVIYYLQSLADIFSRYEVGK